MDNEDKELQEIEIDTEMDKNNHSINIRPSEITGRIQKSFQKTIDELNMPSYSSIIKNNFSGIVTSALNSKIDSLHIAIEQNINNLSAISESLNPQYHFDNNYLSDYLNNYYQSYDLISSAVDSIHIPEYIQDILSSSLSNFENKIANVLEYNIDLTYLLNPFQEVMRNYQETYSAIFKSIDFGNLLLDKMHAILNDSFDRTISDEVLDRERFSKVYLETLVECEWFPYISDSIKLQDIRDILEIRKHTRTVKSRTKQLNTFIFSVFNKPALKIIKHDWYHIIADKTKSRILRQCIEAHINGQYALTVCTLAPMWESIIKDKKNHKGYAKPKAIQNYLFELVDEEGFPNSQIIKDYYEQFTMRHFNDENDVKDDIPSRHPIAHGCFPKYPSKKMSLNAILFTDFLINL